MAGVSLVRHADPRSGLWVSDFGFGIGVEVREEWLHAGERIELIGVYEVYAVGVIDAHLAPKSVLADPLAKQGKEGCT